MENPPADDERQVYSSVPRKAPVADVLVFALG